MFKKSRSRDNNTHYRLVNWGAFIRDGMADIPRQHPKGASWQEQVTDRVTESDPPEVRYIDIDDAELTQGAMIICMIHDMETATKLTQAYRDGWSINGLRRCRNRFWKYL